MDRWQSELGPKGTHSNTVNGYTALYRRRRTRTVCQAGKLLRTAPPLVQSETIATGTKRSILTVSDAALMWIEEGKRRNLERSTVEKRHSHYEHHIRPLIGSTPIRELTSIDVDRFVTDLSIRECANDPGRTISPAMVKKVLASLKGLLRYMEGLGHLERNPAAPISFRTSTRGRRRIRAGLDFPTKEEVRIITANAPDRWRPLLLTAALTGMRSSELRALTWADIDFHQKIIHVRRRADAWGVIGRPKSEAGEREIPMMPSVTETLREWSVACPRRSQVQSQDGVSGLVFPNGRGNSESHSNIVNRGFIPIQLDLGIIGRSQQSRSGAGQPRARYGLHALRHFFSTYMIECGVTPKRLQAMLGHSTFSMTMDTYGHLFENHERDRELMASADRQLFG